MGFKPFNFGTATLAGPAPASDRVCVTVHVSTPNPTNGSQGNWRLAAKRAREQRDATYLALMNVYLTPPAPTDRIVRLTRISVGRLDDDGPQSALKHIRDAVAVFLFGGRPGEHDNDPRVTWKYEQQPGKRGHPAVVIEIEPRGM